MAFTSPTVGRKSVSARETSGLLIRTTRCPRSRYPFRMATLARSLTENMTPAPGCAERGSPWRSASVRQYSLRARTMPSCATPAGTSNSSPRGAEDDAMSSAPSSLGSVATKRASLRRWR
ncbi:hypothetical protein EMIHUDRAFT_450217 [Emiliania huxleyi CCMP1516]|uniref:Uncharacterized protein n=2 Tax=Emiliania huxleyi TaxID=2903 RepID=A0A0D3JUQ1_EMIH1|nr:hypothetical protein EMIHUDRAFT_450217 [Emiliania huxleyi CCMP1516]EOD27236.1 hypothetical protein EMIHUDRAFT_450217 [Emiliania huxleyi CCMP1516]|eukprot:XP_005779665.1 hypothetical protein EMIHUDRAFT_450217 [Emiliania huxleyi CCMP1516]